MDTSASDTALSRIPRKAARRMEVAMAWQLGKGVLLRGASIRIAWQFNYEDVGPQFAIAKPSYAPSGAEHDKFNRMSVDGHGMLVRNGSDGVPAGVRYEVVVTNDGWQNASFLLKGGALQ
ncbi:hypothetical protein ACIBCM_18085 [Streptomyces sp. NPDC051018]|uniref:hypothetical protein n=1 Tax=Streptomyces sp. NPDC051018 TaxID=3365639 RepID=UPI0037AA04B0